MLTIQTPTRQNRNALYLGRGMFLPFDGYLWVTARSNMPGMHGLLCIGKFNPRAHERYNPGDIIDINRKAFLEAFRQGMHLTTGDIFEVVRARGPLSRSLTEGSRIQIEAVYQVGTRIVIWYWPHGKGIEVMMATDLWLLYPYLATNSLVYEGNVRDDPGWDDVDE